MTPSLEGATPPADGTGVVGDACANDASCAGGTQGGCEEPASGFKGGYCTLACTSDAQCSAGSQCIVASGICLKNCTTDTDCRGNGYQCFDIGTGTSVCGNSANGAGAVGDPCTNLWDCSGGDFGECVTGSAYPGGY